MVTPPTLCSKFFANQSTPSLPFPEYGLSVLPALIAFKQLGQYRHTRIDLLRPTRAHGLVEITAAGGTKSFAVFPAQIDHVKLQNERGDENILDLKLGALDDKYIVFFLSRRIP